MCKARASGRTATRTSAYTLQRARERDAQVQAQEQLLHSDIAHETDVASGTRETGDFAIDSVPAPVSEGDTNGDVLSDAAAAARAYGAHLREVNAAIVKRGQPLLIMDIAIPSLAGHGYEPAHTKRQLLLWQSDDTENAARRFSAQYGLGNHRIGDIQALREQRKLRLDN